ncbi:MAG TPA: DUF4369 domain-containing protein, partial [Flavisolibacter sp.]|nr:DUF4369 domain-containing protein [Flavisolibacter sp.]
MKYLLFLVVMVPALCFAQTQGFIVTGSVAGLKDGDVTITSTQEGNQLLAKAPIKTGAFTIAGHIPEPGLYWLKMGSEQPQHIYLENKKITVS